MAAELIEAPGLARLERCEDCAYCRSVGIPCDCEGTGFLVWHACVACGDGARWIYTDDGVTCTACGARWTAEDPRWTAQRVPDRLLVAVA